LSIFRRKGFRHGLQIVDIEHNGTLVSPLAPAGLPPLGIRRRSQNCSHSRCLLICKSSWSHQKRRRLKTGTSHSYAKTRLVPSISIKGAKFWTDGPPYCGWTCGYTALPQRFSKNYLVKSEPNIALRLFCKKVAYRCWQGRTLPPIKRPWTAPLPIGDGPARRFKDLREFDEPDICQDQNVVVGCCWRHLRDVAVWQLNRKKEKRGRRCPCGSSGQTEDHMRTRR